MATTSRSMQSRPRTTMTLAATNSSILFSFLRHRTFEKSVERCELSILDGPSSV
ncbi:hypothetical protein FIBSPDRAFT_510795 [Athelia psychrophila]|uniref:Uncharacterized protein n=1 Tax=Athelia psychrophila TaxID=1759441 RepID=A0A166UYU4_9AGAM|nr:hypothetical protein FIBSPDRAFT_510795 [Fibularhizoctonia sp. CBS 109695]